MSTIFCAKCGHELRKEHAFCPRCGTPTEAVVPLERVETAPVVGPQPSQTGSRTGGVVGKLAVIVLILLILIVPVFPRDRVVYANGVTQTVTMSTSYSTSFQTYATTTQLQISVYQGTLQYVPDQYFSQNYYSNYNLNSYYQNYYGYPNYWNYNSKSPNCHHAYYDDYYCSYSFYYYYPYYSSYPNYYSSYPNYYSSYPSSSYPYSSYNNLNTVTVKTTDNIVSVQQTQESNGFLTFTLTHYDGTSDTYRHVFKQDLVQSGTSTVTGTTTLANTITNSVVNPVTSAVPCQSCIPHHVTDHVSLLQLLLGF